MRLSLLFRVGSPEHVHDRVVPEGCTNPAFVHGPNGPFGRTTSKELEIVVVRHELAILRRRTRRTAMTWTDGLLLTAASLLPPRARWRSFIITHGRHSGGIGAWWGSVGRTRVDTGSADPP